MEKKSGYYFGTEIFEKWWKRYRQWGFFARGLGKYWIGDDGLYFHRYLTREPLIISFSDIKEVKSGKWHGGRWGHGQIVTKLIWFDGENILSSGFILGKNEVEIIAVHNIILSHINK